MIANALRTEIDRYARQIRHSNPIFYKAEDGSFSRECLAVYLTNIHHLLCHTPIYLNRARDRALQEGDKNLVHHYQQKLGEEVGHDVWAERDIKRVSDTVQGPINPQVLPAMHGLLRYLAETIDRDPLLYLSYILFAEYLTVLLGGEWIRLLEENCGIPRTSMTAVGNHVELDKEHVQEALDCIDDLVSEPSKLPLMRDVLIQTFGYFDRFCEEVTAESARPIRSSRIDAVQQISAA